MEQARWLRLVGVGPGRIVRTGRQLTSATTAVTVSAMASGATMCTWRASAAPASAPSNMATTRDDGPQPTRLPGDGAVGGDTGDGQCEHGGCQVRDGELADRGVLDPHRNAEKQTINT